jgi:BMFP domain-containing protein YqiC
MGRKAIRRRTKTVEEDIPEQVDEPENDAEQQDIPLSPEEEDALDIISRFRQIGIDGGEDLAISFSRQREGALHYLNTVPIGEITSMEEYASDRWGGGRYSWRLKKGTHWASPREVPAGIPISGRFNIDGRPKDDVQQSAAVQSDGSDQLRQAVALVAEIAKPNSNIGEYATIMKSVSDAAKSSIESVQKQSEQNITSMMAMMKSQMDMVLGVMREQSAMAQQSNNDKIELLKQASEEKMQLMEVIADIKGSASRSIGDRLLDTFENAAGKVGPDGLPFGLPAPAQAPAQNKPAEKGDDSMNVLMNIFHIIDFCFDNDAPTQKCAMNIYMKYSGVNRVVLISYLNSKGVRGTIEAAKQTLQAQGITVTPELDKYAETVLGFVLKGAENDHSSTGQNGNKS